MILSQRLRYLYFAVLSTNAVRGIFIVTLAWAGFVAGGNIAAVGQLFLIGHIVNVCLGPFIGAHIDRTGRKKLIIIGLFLNGIALSLPLASSYYFSDDAMFWVLAFMALVSSLAGLLMVGALDAIQQVLTPASDRAKVSAVAGGLRQGAMVAGAGLGGVLIHSITFEGTFLIGAILSVLSIAAIRPLSDAVVTNPRRNGFLSDIVDGVREFRRSPYLLRLGLLTTIAFSIGQLSNALLAGFVVDHLGKDSRYFGIVDALWSIGGVSASFVIAFILHRYRMINYEYFLCFILGLSTAYVAFVDSPMELAVLYFAIGGLFSAVKVLCDGRVLEMCPSDMVGRVRTHYQMLFSILGIAIYITPSLSKGTTAAQTYLVWGLAVAAMSMALFMWNTLSEKNAIETRTGIVD